MLTNAEIKGLIIDSVEHLELGILESEELEQSVIFATASIAKRCNEEFAATQEQLAEMRTDVLKAVQRQICMPCEEASSCRYDPTGALIPVPDWQIDSAPSLELCKAHPFLQALSAAPKRGRVLWEANGKIREEAGYHEDERSSYHYIAYYVEPLRITDFDSFLAGTDLDGKCKWLYDGLLVTVTVREEAE